MVARAVVSFLILAFVWTVGIPDRVAVDPDADPDRYADAMGVPEVFEPPSQAHTHGIEPAPYRAQIERIENVLYRRGRTDFGDAEAVESAAARLSDSLLRREGLRGRQAGLVLMSFAGRVGGRTDSGYTLPSIVGMRSEWETVRGIVFRPVPWMRSASSDLDRVQEPPPRPVDPRTDAAIAEAEETLRRLMLRGQREAERLGEPVYDPDLPSRSDRGQIQAWYRFGERFRRQLHEALAPVDRLDPPPSPTREPLRAEAVRSLREAQEMLRRVPDGAGIWPTPFRTAWEARFQAASAALARTREQMSQARAAPEASRDHAGWNR